ncbi:hypothetical protein HRTV-28_gp59 [Halorubrum tailed virus 28]|uniref:Uncharacterized protein n=1 Tax=Halorubrum tailed virus 28 TaxID=2878009 RepID=A0AAE8Y0B0_9CAUD|nr:hypothetical protein M1M39_gp60 [Halorubrum tailed virus 28]UBF23497.1 hypothetical protein HRTV-28_gp59 [Halorubrum tailed virus 28]
MSENETKSICPGGVDVQITHADMVVLDFDHPDAPPIVLPKAGAERVGSHLNSAAGKIACRSEVDDE